MPTRECKQLLGVWTLSESNLQLDATLLLFSAAASASVICIGTAVVVHASAPKRSDIYLSSSTLCLA